MMELPRALPPLYFLAAPLSQCAPSPHPLPSRPLRLVDPIGFRPFSAVAATATAVARAPEMGASLFRGFTEIKFPKRRPRFVSRRKRASLRPKGPHYSVKCKPGEPIPSSQPNEGSMQGRKEKKRIKQRKDFIMAEKRKRKAHYSVAVKRKEAEWTERKMATVARDQAWVERLAELKQTEAEKKAAMA